MDRTTRRAALSRTGGAGVAVLLGAPEARHAQGKTVIAPMPYFGGKGKVAATVWQRLGDCPNYVEPFLGSGAVLLARPVSHRWWERVETCNDADGFVSNFWRAVQHDPEAVAFYADWPVNENDLHARHAWLANCGRQMVAQLEGNPDVYDARIAGWWVWGMCAWIGSGWCSGDGPWFVEEDGALRKRVHLGNAGQGINRQLVHLGDAGQGINRQLVHLGDAGQGHAAAWSEHLVDIMLTLADRLRRVRVCSGDWMRVCGETPTIKQGLTGVFLDPPYADTANRTADLYREDSLSVAHAVRQWAIENGDNPLLRICLAGYENEHAMPTDWSVVAWKAKGGYASQGDGSNDNSTRERLWFSPHCLKPEQMRGLFDDLEMA